MKKLLLFILTAVFTFNVNAAKKVVYVTLQKTMDATATTVDNDPIIQMLKADPNLEVTVKITTSASEVISDLSDYDVIIVQEAISGSAAILQPTGSLALKTLPKPTIYNKTYAFKQGRALTTSTAAGGKEATSTSLTVQSSALSNELFKACTIGTSNEINIFKAQTTDAGASGTKALNYSTGNNVSGSTLLAVPTALASDASPCAIFVNDMPAGTTIDSETTISRIITLGMNFGAISANFGKNITDDGLTIWRNAVYILAGLAVPDTKATLPSGIIIVDTNFKVVNTEYFTINGQLVKEPIKGIYLKRLTYENGATKLEKIVLTEDFAR